MARSRELFSDGVVLLETARLIEDALCSGIRLEAVFVRRGAVTRVDSFLRELSPATTIYEIPSALFQSLATTETSQGVLALAELRRWREVDLFPAGAALVLIAAGLQDPGNLGAMIRAAEAFGATGVMLTRGTVSPYNAKAIRAMAGALLRMPILREMTAPGVQALLSRYQVPLFAAVVQGGTPISAIRWKGPAAVAIGSEGSGVCRELAEAAAKITVPMRPPADSLNAAAAAAVVLYEIARQRESRKSS